MYPSIADGRDITCDLSGGKDWSPITTLAEMMKKVPEFVSVLLANTKYSICGLFHLGHYYSLYFWKDLPEICMK